MRLKIKDIEGIATDPSKTSAVSRRPISQNKKEIQQFLGLANYHRKFVKNFPSTCISKPLHRLIDKDVLFNWTMHCKTAFDELRRCLGSFPVLAYSVYNRWLILNTDAIDTGIGVALSQISDARSERVIACISLSLSRLMQRYCVIRKELLAVVLVIQHFLQYHLGQEFTLLTGHRF